MERGGSIPDRPLLPVGASHARHILCGGRAGVGGTAAPLGDHCGAAQSASAYCTHRHDGGGIGVGME